MNAPLGVYRKRAHLMVHLPRIRVVAALATLTLAGGSMALFAPPASAADIGSIDTASAAPTVYAGITNQAAGSWTLSSLPAVSIGDKITIQVDDNDAAANCAATSDTVGFTGAPTVANSTVGNTAAFAKTVTPSLGACTVTGTKDVLTLTATASGGAGAVLKLTGVAYDVGSAAGTGSVSYQVNGGGFVTDDTNATVSAVRVGSATPAQLIPTGTQNTPVGDIVLVEQRAGAIPVSGITGVCIQLLSPAGATFDTTTIPTVTAAGNGVPTLMAVTSNAAAFLMTTASSGATGSTFTIHGLKLDTLDTTGPVVYTAGSTCGGTDFNIGDRLGFIGGTDRVAGSDRYATAARIANEQPQYDCLAGDTVVIARGDNFPDALAASYLAGQNDVPVFLTAPGSVPAETMQALDDHGVTNVVLVGGTTAISQSVADLIDARPTRDCEGGAVSPTQTIAVDRVSGADRYATAKAVAEKAGLDQAGTAGAGLDGVACNEVTTAIVTSGENFPDALAAGPLAFSGVNECGDSNPLPLLLTPKDSLSPAAVGAITNLDIEQVILLGGTSAVSTAVETALEALPGVSVVRVAGADRQATAVAIAERILGPNNFGDFDGGGFLVSRPDSFPDALAASSLGGNEGWPMFLAASPTSLGSTATNGIASYPNDNALVLGTLVGGTSALADTVGTQVATAIASQG